MSVFPTSIDSDSTLYVAKDNIQTTLSVAMSPSDTLAVLASTTGWVANMIATVESEQMLVTSVLGGGCIVTRAFGGTVAAAHASGKTFSNFVDSAYQLAAKQAIIAIEKSTLNAVNLINYGAVQDWNGTTGTNNIAAFNAAIADGKTNIFLPKNCMFIASGSLVPAGLNIEGEDWRTSAIKSASDPSTALLLVGAYTVIRNCNLMGSGSNDPTNCPCPLYVNGRSVTHYFASTGYSIVIDTDGPADLAASRFVTWGGGDAVYGECHGTGGSGGRFTVQDNGAQAIYVDRRNASAGMIMADDPGFTGSDTGTGYSYFTPIRTSGDLLNFAHRTSTFVGNVLWLDMAQATFGGGFTGNYLGCLKGGAFQFRVDSSGFIYIGAGQAQILSGTGDPNGVHAAPVGSMFLRTDGGAGTTLYVKESGGGGGGGWVAK